MTNLPTASHKPILVCVDLGKHSIPAIEHALSLACDKNCPLVVLHVAHESGESAGFYRRQNRNSEATPIGDIAATLLQELVDTVVRSRKPGGCAVDVTTRVVEGIPAGRIADVAELVDAEVVVLISTARNSFGRFWHGSVAADVGRRTGKRLLVLPAEPRSGTRDSGDVSPLSFERSTV